MVVVVAVVTTSLFGITSDETLTVLQSSRFPLHFSSAQLLQSESQMLRTVFVGQQCLIIIKIVIFNEPNCAPGTFWTSLLLLGAPWMRMTSPTQSFQPCTN